MTYVFGPVASRRLGLSLGVDLTPAKTCSYDCLYCQVGRTTCLSIEPQSLAPLKDVLRDLELQLEKTTPDYVTFSGSGEPTLHEGIGEAIAFVKRRSNVRVAVLTNGSLLWRQEVRQRLLAADVIMPTLSTVNEETYRKIHRPHPGLSLPKVIEGLKSLRGVYGGELSLEVVLLAGFNDSFAEIEALSKVLTEIRPERIQLNTVVRPPADQRALALDMERMEAVRTLLGAKAEIIAFMPPKLLGQGHDSLADAVLAMAKRRPVRASDIAQGLGCPLGDVERVTKGLLLKGRLKTKTHRGETYFLALEK